MIKKIFNIKSLTVRINCVTFENSLCDRSPNLISFNYYTNNQIAWKLPSVYKILSVFSPYLIPLKFNNKQALSKNTLLELYSAQNLAFLVSVLRSTFLNESTVCFENNPLSSI